MGTRNVPPKPRSQGGARTENLVAKNRGQIADASAMAVLSYARQYYQAAEIIFSNNRNLARPLLFLYFHTVELLLKSFLRAHGRKRSKHQLWKLYQEARQFGLGIPGDNSFRLENVVALLESGNKTAAFRYFTLESRTEPDLDGTRNVVRQLLGVVEPVVESTCDPTSVGIPVKVDITMFVR